MLDFEASYENHRWHFTLIQMKYLILVALLKKEKFTRYQYKQSHLAHLLEKFKFQPGLH